MSTQATKIERLANWIGGKKVPASATEFLPVTAPSTGEVVAEVPLCGAADIDKAVKVALEAQREWGATTVKDRVQILFRFKAMLEAKSDQLAEICSLENGKTLDEARASVARGIECVEFATSLPQIFQGKNMEVSRGVECRTRREPVGVVAGITPFNFPAMVPLWMFPLAIAAGNAFILKPSEQTPLCAMELAAIADECGLPPGILNIVHGGRDAVEAICDHPGIDGVGFVGSTGVAKAVYTRCSSNGKRVRALGGAKNHLVVMPDADPEMTASNIVASFTGCAGQRCMAASVVIAVGEVGPILDRIRTQAASLVPGRELGSIISRKAHERIVSYIDKAEKDGLSIVLDGRGAQVPEHPNGNWLAPTIIDHAPKDHPCSCEEIFGPVLSIIRVSSLDEAMEIENDNPYGNAAAIYTSNGGTAEFFSANARAGMIGINVGVPVPREPFGFGGLFDSRFGDGDLTGEQAIDFWTITKKVTVKWSAGNRANWMS